MQRLHSHVFVIYWTEWWFCSGSTRFFFLFCEGGIEGAKCICWGGKINKFPQNGWFFSILPIWLGCGLDGEVLQLGGGGRGWQTPPMPSLVPPLMISLVWPRLGHSSVNCNGNYGVKWMMYAIYVNVVLRNRCIVLETNFLHHFNMAVGKP